MSRSVLFDTETTGLEPNRGDRVIEIAALELVNDLPTGAHFHTLIDPEKFLGDADIIAHNAPFDFGFLNAELGRLGLAPLGRERMVDTLDLAKKRFPGMPNSLDALCRRFSIDLSARTTHNALLDCKLLAEVYVELTGGRQRGLSLATDEARLPVAVYEHTGPRTARLVTPTEAELAAHAAMVGKLKEPVWLLE